MMRVIHPDDGGVFHDLAAPQALDVDAVRTHVVGSQRDRRGAVHPGKITLSEGMERGGGQLDEFNHFKHRASFR